jgi:hypothetical protein
LLQTVEGFVEFADMIRESGVSKSGWL